MVNIDNANAFQQVSFRQGSFEARFDIYQ